MRESTRQPRGFPTHASEASFAAEAAVDRTCPLNHQNYVCSEGDTCSHQENYI